MYNINYGCFDLKNSRIKAGVFNGEPCDDALRGLNIETTNVFAYQPNTGSISHKIMLSRNFFNARMPENVIKRE